MGRSREKPSKMEIDLSLKIDTDDEHKEEEDERVKEDEEQEMAQIQDNNKEEIPEATAGEIEDDASVIETSLQDNTKTKEVIIFFIINMSRSKSVTLLPP